MPLLLAETHAPHAAACEDDALGRAHARLEQRQHLLRHDGVGEAVQVKDLLVLRAQGRGGRRRARGARVVDEDIEAAVRAGDVRDGGVDGRVGGDIDGDGLQHAGRDRGVVGRKDLLHGRGAFLRVAGAQQHAVGAGLGELLAGVPAETLVGAGDEDDGQEIAHGDHLWRLSTSSLGLEPSMVK